MCPELQQNKDDFVKIQLSEFSVLWEILFREKEVAN